jgi:Intein splicing domain
MATLVYSPRIQAHIQITNKQGNTEILDLSEDLVAGTLSIRSNALHTFQFQLQNTQRKYDGMIRPMDKIVVTMTRIGAAARVFSGYMNNGPVFSVWPRVLNLSATCTLKRLAYWSWDSTAPASATLLQTWNNTNATGASGTPSTGNQTSAADGGLRDLVLSLLTQVCNWPAGQIHIGSIPPAWFQFAQAIGDEIEAAADESSLIGSLGGTASVGGTSLTSGATLPAGTYGGVSINATQAQNASTIYSVAAGLNLTAHDASMGIGCAMQESSLINLTSGTADSVGLFQQRPSQGWGTAAQCEDPTYASQQFFSHLIQVPSYETIPYAQAIQAVQRSANGSLYAKWQTFSDAAVAQLQTLNVNSSNAQNLVGNSTGGSIGEAAPSGATGRNVAAYGYNLITSRAANPIHYTLGGDSPDTTAAADVQSLDCFTGDTIVHTSNRGPIAIQDVVEGDSVWTWDHGALASRKVVRWMERGAKQTYTMRSRGRMVRATGNHQFLVIARELAHRNPQTGRYDPVEWRTEWRKLSNIQRGDLVVSIDRLPSPTEPQQLPDGTPITEEIAWLLGEYVGDGSLSGGSVNICAFKDDVRQRIIDIVKRVWDANGKTHPTQGVMISSVSLRKVIQGLGLSVSHAQHKRVPDVVKKLPARELRAFLDGYNEADGWRDKGKREGHLTYSSCSRELISEVRALHIGLGDRTTNISTNYRKHPIVIKGRLVKKALPLHTFVAYPDSPKRQQNLLEDYGVRRALPDRAFTIERITSIKPDVIEPTYDIEVEGSHNFLADGMVAHNCSSFVQWAYWHASNVHLVRTAAQQQAACTHQFPAATGQFVKGAVLFSEPGHIELSLGNGYTAAAHSSSFPLGEFGQCQVSIAYNGPSFTTAGLLPGIDYTDAATTQAAADLLTSLTGTQHTVSNPDEFPGDGTGTSTPGAAGSSTTGSDSAASVFNALVNVYTWGYVPSVAGQVLAGPRALMNDDPILPFVANLMQASMRSWCSAPNGDFMAWFPDYFNIWNYAGIMTIQPIELMDFTVDWADANIVTHQYVIGSIPGMGTVVDQTSGTLDATTTPGLQQELTSQGIATMDFPQIFRAIFGQDATQDFLTEYLNRFGARPDVEQVPSIQQGQPEFFLALYLFMQHWANQFSATIPTTFMPELWPGMIMQIPAFSFQAYVVNVTHTFSYGPSGSFTTQTDVCAPARIGDSDVMSVFGMLPEGGTTYLAPEPAQPTSPSTALNAQPGS